MFFTVGCLLALTAALKIIFLRPEINIYQYHVIRAFIRKIINYVLEILS